MSSWKTEFAVQMTCNSCVEECKAALARPEVKDDIEKVEVNLDQQTVLVEGKAPPSRIARALKSTGRQVIVRGTGAAKDGATTAAVAILECYDPPKSSSEWEGPASQKVRGLARLLQAETDRNVILLDLTVKIPLDLPVEQRHKKYNVYVSTAGDLSSPPATTGKPLRSIGELVPDPITGYADLFLEIEGLAMWEIIGRGFVVEAIDAQPGAEEAIWAGVVARSSGVWGNKKEVCSCTGLSMWEENRLQPHL